MKCDKQNMLLYAVTDRAWVGKQTLYEQVESALKGGVTCVQLREKELDDEAFLKEAVEIHALCQRYGVPFFVNDIGGIHKENILQLKGTGVDGVALVSAIFAADDIETECKELKALSEQII